MGSHRAAGLIKWGVSAGIAAGLLGAGGASAASVTAPPSSYFDPPVVGAGTYRVVGSLTPPSWSWGKIELLEGRQTFRTEGYNLRTEKLRYQDTYQTADYPLQTYYGDLNQQLVDGFNLAYGAACGQKGSTITCGDVGPTRPEGRYVLLHQGPRTAAGDCDRTEPPMLLVHGAMQDGNVWIAPAGNDGRGNAYGGGDPDGPVSWLENAGVCTYAVTFGNFHGDNFNQAISLKNAIDRVKALTGQSQVDLAAWSKGVVPVDLYLSNVASWGGWGTRYFDQIAALSAAQVPAFAADVRSYYALSGPHKGIDLSWRHPYDDLLIPAVTENAPLGRGPMMWSRFSALQCLTWGWYDSEDDPPPLENPYAVSICEERGATWNDFWNNIVLTNVSGLDSQGRPVWEGTLEDQNREEGLGAGDFDFDQYNISVFGAVDDAGRFVSAYLGQLQVVHDFRDEYPVPCRTCEPFDWGALDTDETGWFDWLELKLVYNPLLWYLPAGAFTDLTHTDCRETAYDPEGSPCFANHLWRYNDNKVGRIGIYTTYKVFDSLGMDVAREMGGDLMARLATRGLDRRLSDLVVVYGTELGETFFETDGMACPTCDPHADGVLFESSIAATTQLTQGWSAADLSRVEEWPLPLGHLEVGVDAALWQDVLRHRQAL